MISGTPETIAPSVASMAENTIIAEASRAGVCLASVESCTGGLIARRLTAIAGSSQVFWGGFVTYDNSAKETLVGVPAELLALKGAVSPEVAGMMAEGGLAAMNHAIGATDRSSVASASKRICVSTTGIAGPSGGSLKKPVGLCYVGIAATGLPTAVMELRQPAGQSREQNQNAFADSALAAVAKLVQAFSAAALVGLALLGGASPAHASSAIMASPRSPATSASHTSRASRDSGAPIRLELTTGVPHQQVFVATDFMGWAQWAMNEDKPGHYAYSFEAPWEPSIAYKFIVDGKWMPDPANPAIEPDGHDGSNSVIQVPSFKEDPLLTLQPGVKPLSKTVLTLTDLEGAPRSVTVLAPIDRSPSVTVYFQDGDDFLNRTGAAALLANLSSEPGFPALTGVFIAPKDRMREYEFLPAYADFVTQVVVPSVETRFSRTGGSRTQRLLLGSSLGGLITLYTALRSPEVFGYAASQSASLWFQDGALVPALGAPVSDPSRQLRLFMDCGTYEDPDMAKYNRLGSQAALTAGHSVVYHEHPSTHDWIAWRNELQQVLRYFFSRR